MSGLGIADAPLDTNESTFFLAPQLESPPTRAPEHSAGDYREDVELQGGDAPADSSSDVDGPSAEAANTKAAPVRGKQTRKKWGPKMSDHGIEFPPLPPALVKRLAQNFAKTSGISKPRISPEVHDGIMQATEWFFKQAGTDLGNYAQHAGRNTIEDNDMLMLLRRYGTARVGCLYYFMCYTHAI